MARVYTRSAPNSTREQLAKMMIDLGDDASRLPKLVVADGVPDHDGPILPRKNG